MTRLIFPLLLCVALWAGFNKKTLGTKVTANGDVIVLDWDKEHPWDAQFTSGVTLFAEYLTSARGLVAERLSNARPIAPGQRSIHFRLPGTLTNAPVGPVCLYFKVGQRILPVRAANAQGDETARFRNQQWEASAVSQVSRVEHERKLEQLRKSLAAAENTLRASEDQLSKKGWQSRQACDAIPAPSFAESQKPADVFPVTEHEQLSRRICVSRVVWGQVYVKGRIKPEYRLSVDTGFVQPPAILESFLRFATEGTPVNENTQIRNRQLAEFWADWRKWSDSAPGYKNPAFGQYDDHLDLQDLSTATVNGLFRLNNDFQLELATDRKTDPALLMGFVGASLEAYSRCVVDGQHQLAAKLLAWSEMQERAPQLAARAREELAGSCRKQFDDIARFTAAKASLETELADEEKKTFSNGGIAGISAQVVNTVRCNPKDLSTTASR